MSVCWTRLLLLEYWFGGGVPGSSAATREFCVRWNSCYANECLPTGNIQARRPSDCQVSAAEVLSDFNFLLVLETISPINPRWVFRWLVLTRFHVSFLCFPFILRLKLGRVIIRESIVKLSDCQSGVFWLNWGSSVFFGGRAKEPPRITDAGFQFLVGF